VAGGLGEGRMDGFGVGSMAIDGAEDDVVTHPLSSAVAIATAATRRTVPWRVRHVLPEARFAEWGGFTPGLSTLGEQPAGPLLRKTKQ
jgi:hypothetical protein